MWSDKAATLKCTGERSLACAACPQPPSKVQALVNQQQPAGAFVKISSL